MASLALATPMASAYLTWETVTLPASSGASCGNGTPYRFFVNKMFFQDDMVILYEGGGACWDQKSCEGNGHLSASNPDGIPKNYMTSFNMAALGLVTPFSSRINPFEAFRTQTWNMVYLPYCTGDVHTGSKVTVYSDRDANNPRIQHHRGQANIRAAAAWLRKEFGRPDKVFITGFSAGGVGSTATYNIMRDALNPRGRVTLGADSGLLIPASRNETPATAPSLPLHNKIRQAWGLDEPDGMVTRLSALPGFDPNDLGSVNSALAMRYPNDRFGYMAFQEDGNFSAFSYEKFYPEIQNEPDAAKRKRAINRLWRRDLNRLLPQLWQHANVDYHIPFWRELNDSHCLTIIDFNGTGIEERNIGHVQVFLDRQLDRKSLLRGVEQDQQSDFGRGGSWAQDLMTMLRRLFG